MSGKRVVLLFVEDADATDDLQQVLSAVEHRPLHPLPKGANPRVTPQEPWTDEEVNEYVLTVMHRLVGKIEWGQAVIVP